MSVSENYDANDVAKLYGLDKVREAFEQRVSPWPEFAPYDDEGVPANDDDSSVFDTLTISEIEALPPPAWLVHELISEDGLSILYGDPGTGKSFVALDMALRLAMGMEWHGRAAKSVGVLYIAGEGARGIGKRVKGWRLKHGIKEYEVEGIPFALLPVPVQLLDENDRAKLIRTIDAVKKRLSFDVGLTVVDTVSRSISGVDENSQDTMSAFVKACDDIKHHTGGALLGIHHSGKDKERGMRGSSVLLGACDAALKLEKSERIITLSVEKQKDAEEQPPLYFDLEKFVWNDGEYDAPGDEHSTLVPVLADRPREGAASISMDQIRQAMGVLVDAWSDGKPLSNKPQTRSDGRYAPAIFARRFGGEASAWKDLIAAWLEGGNLAVEMADRKTKVTGLRVVEAVL